MNGDLEEKEVFMNLPPGFKKDLGINKVCWLKKILIWTQTIFEGLVWEVWKGCKRLWILSKSSWSCHVLQTLKIGKVVVLIVYVDDIILIEDDIKEIEALKERLVEKFEIKYLGALKYFLSMDFARSKEGIFVNQCKYVLDLLGEIGMLGCKATETLLNPIWRYK